MIGRLAVGCYAYSLSSPCEKGLAAKKVEIEAACATRNEQGWTGSLSCMWEVPAGDLQKRDGLTREKKRSVGFEIVRRCAAAIWPW
jgi:hypothetical protein